MKVYHLNLEIGFTYDNLEHYSNVYTSFDNAVEFGKQYLERRAKCAVEVGEYNIKDAEMPTVDELLEQVEYTFEIEEIEDLEYAENFDIKLFPKYEYLKQNIQPTHKVYELDYKGNIKGIYIEYRIQQKEYPQAMFIMSPDDFKEGAGEKFKIGDIVTLKKDEYRSRDLETYEEKRLYVIRWLPIRVEGSEYFENTYAVISNYYDGLFTHEEREYNIEKYEGKVDPDSPIGFLQRIIKNDVAVSEETWTDLKVGKILLKDKDNYKSLYEFEEGDNWGFYTNTLSPRYTGLPANLMVGFGCFYDSIKDKNPKIRVHATKDYNKDFYITISKKPKVIIGESNLPKEDLEKIYEFVAQNYDGLMEYYNSNGEMDIEDLHNILNLKRRDK